MTPDPNGLINEATPVDLLFPKWEGDEIAILQALFEVQAGLPNIPKNGKGKKTWVDKASGKTKEFSYDYILLDDLMPIVKATFFKHRILIFQASYSCLIDKNLYVMTYFRHVDTGGGVRFAYPVCSLKEKIGQQDIAASFTPAKRHAITAGLAIVAETDKDGKGSRATVGGEPEKTPEPEAKKTYRAVTKEETPTVAQKKADAVLATKLWTRALSNQVILKDILSDLKEAEGIKTQSTKDNIIRALTIRELCTKADTQAQIMEARRVLSEIPEKLRTDTKISGVRAEEIFNGFIDESEATLPVPLNQTDDKP